MTFKTFQKSKEKFQTNKIFQLFYENGMEGVL